MSPTADLSSQSQPVPHPAQVLYLKFTGGGHCRWCWSGAMLVMGEGEIGRA